MVHASRTIKVNNDSTELPLTRSLVWRGLVMKAENPLPFVPVITSCKVVERRKDGLVREIVDKGDTITEVVTFQPERMVKFERMSGRVLGTILNEIVEDDNGDLALRFTFTLAIDGVADGSAEENDFAASMEEGYLMAVRATLKAMRKLASENTLTAAAS
jgi:Acetylaranotin biosynthesis cluster protein L